MTDAGLAFLVLASALVLGLPRRWAPLPLLMAAAYMTQAQQVEIGPFTFTMARLVIAAGVLRVLLRGERPRGGLLPMDRLMLALAAWALASSGFHQDPWAALIFRLGFAYNALGVYFLVRTLCTTPEDARHLCRLTAVLLAPVALEMLSEHATGRNLFSVLGGVSETPAVREGRLRAQGPFAHSILAGSVGAAALPLAAGLWATDRRAALLGLGASTAMVLASASSGPLLSLFAAILALAFWRYRAHMRLVRWLAVAGYVALDLVMKAPAYYLIARIDLAGGSTGWHRARLIESGIAHLGEWWLAGTDYTRHWMPTSVSWSPDHTDITNHYLGLGVLGGLPLTFLFVAVLAAAFARVGRAVRAAPGDRPEAAYLAWALGSSLFAHAVTGLGVSYFDQSFVFLYATLGAIGSLPAVAPAPARAPVGRAVGAVAPRWAPGRTLPGA